MAKEFNRSMSREISQKVQEVLSDYFESADYEFTINGGSYASDKLKLNLEVRMKNADGTIVVSEYTHNTADVAAKLKGLVVEGHLIGSTWNIDDNTYIVVGYTPKRPKYPVQLKRADGQMSKSSFAFLARGKQLIIPTLEEFTKWFTMDPDSDAILESDAEICDNVQRYLDSNYPEEEGDKFYELVDKFNQFGIAHKKWAKRAYELLFKEAPATMESAYLGMKVIYKEETRK